MSPKCFIMETIALFSASEKSHCALVVCDSEIVTVAVHRALRISTAAFQRCLAVARLVPRGTAAVTAHVLCTPYNHAPVYSVNIRSHMHKIHVCLAVTCHLHFGQNGQDHLSTTAVSRRWNGHRSKSQHRMLTPETRTRDFSIMSPSLYHCTTPSNGLTLLVQQ